MSLTVDKEERKEYSNYRKKNPEVKINCLLKRILFEQIIRGQKNGKNK